ncbi:MAG: ATP-binding cassette domain-containing protein [Eubacteriales bacterium]|nr:ATP-binding cassette domain-containing protein [Eubacteriales bacterium]
MPIEIKDLSFSYDNDKFINNLNLNIECGEMLGIMGNTGCGKSTLVQLVAGLIKPDNGQIIIDGDNITNKKFDKAILRKKLGIVFQFPEMQLFEQTVQKDIYFGLKKFRLSDEEKYKRAKDILALLNLDFDKIKDKSPLALSGGEKRKIAVAGILVCYPKYLILDEPIAGLDSDSRENFMKLLVKLKKTGITIIIISHNADYIAEYCDRVIVMDNGQIVLNDSPDNIFNNFECLQKLNIGTCSSKQIINLLDKNGISISKSAIKYDDLIKELVREFGDKNG